MAGDEQSLDAVPPNKSFVCHPNQKAGTIVCINCGDIYHKSEFGKKGKVKYVSNHIGFCVKCNLTSNAEPRGSTATLENELSNLKEENRKLIEVNKAANDTISRLENEIKLLKNSFVQASLDPEVISKFSQASAAFVDINNNLKDKSELLSATISELNSKCETLNNNSCANSNKQRSYADVIKNQKINFGKFAPSISVKPTKAEDLDETVKETKKVLTEISKVRVNNVYKHGNRVIVKIDGENDSKRVVDKIKEVMKVDVKIENVKKPRIRIVGIDKDAILQDLDHFTDDIVFRNDLEDTEDASFEVVHKYLSKKSGTFTLIAEVAPSVYHKIMCGDHFLFVGIQRCKFFDDYNVNMCYKCKGYGHCAAKCKSSQYICGLCAGHHKETECDKSITKCINCVKYNENCKLKDNSLNVKTDHVAYNKNYCVVYKNTIKSAIRRIDYPTDN